MSLPDESAVNYHSSAAPLPRHSLELKVEFQLIVWLSGQQCYCFDSPSSCTMGCGIQQGCLFSICVNIGKMLLGNSWMCKYAGSPKKERNLQLLFQSNTIRKAKHWLRNLHECITKMNFYWNLDNQILFITFPKPVLNGLRLCSTFIKSWAICFLIIAHTHTSMAAS